MTIAEMVYIKTELDHVAAVLQWAKTEGYKYGSRESAERSIQCWERKLEFWKNELKGSTQGVKIPQQEAVVHREAQPSSCLSCD